MSIFATRHHTLLVIVSVLSHSKQEKCEMGALQFYLDSSHWGLALDLLRDYCDNSQLHFKLFHCLLDKFNKVRREIMVVELHCSNMYSSTSLLTNCVFLILGRSFDRLCCRSIFTYAKDQEVGWISTSITFRSHTIHNVLFSLTSVPTFFHPVIQF